MSIKGLFSELETLVMLNQFGSNISAWNHASVSKGDVEHFGGVLSCSIHFFLNTVWWMNSHIFLFQNTMANVRSWIRSWIPWGLLSTGWLGSSQELKLILSFHLQPLTLSTTCSSSLTMSEKTQVTAAFEWKTQRDVELEDWWRNMITLQTLGVWNFERNIYLQFCSIVFCLFCFIHIFWWVK